MVNEWKPTPHFWHISIQHFAIQVWRAAGDIELHQKKEEEEEEMQINWRSKKSVG